MKNLWRKLSVCLLAACFFTPRYSRSQTLTQQVDYSTTFERLRRCIEDSPLMKGKNASMLAFPVDAQAHYELVLEKTAKYRNITIHSSAGICVWDTIYC
jgi:hypothetical protein